jgi:hypothetical protein
VRTVATAFAAPPVTTVPAGEVLELVLAGVGASLPSRDAADARLVGHVRSKGGKLIDSQAEVGGWPQLKSGAVSPDTDSDGMPDDWETSRGLNPRDAADGAADRNKDGYSNVEEYLNSLVKPI